MYSVPNTGTGLPIFGIILLITFLLRKRFERVDMNSFGKTKIKSRVVKEYVREIATAIGGTLSAKRVAAHEFRRCDISFNRNFLCMS